MQKTVYFCDLCEKECDKDELNYSQNRELKYLPFSNLTKKDGNVSVLTRSTCTRKLEHLCKDCQEAYNAHKKLLDNLGSTLFYIRNEKELEKICGIFCSPKELKEELVKELVAIQKVWGN